GRTHGWEQWCARVEVQRCERAVPVFEHQAHTDSAACGCGAAVVAGCSVGPEVDPRINREVEPHVAGPVAVELERVARVAAMLVDGVAGTLKDLVMRVRG